MRENILSRLRSAVPGRAAILRATMLFWPMRLKAALFDALCDDPRVVQANGRRNLARISAQRGIDGLRASGQYGRVVGSPNDLVVFPHYAEHWCRRDC